jgi:hypothetical protein
VRIRARMSMSADGYVTTPSGWPSLTADPSFVSGRSHGIREFLSDCEAAVMGRVIVYVVSDRTDASPTRVAGWAPASQRNCMALAAGATPESDLAHLDGLDADGPDALE